MTDSDGGAGLPIAGYRHDFAKENGKGIRFHLLETNLPKNPRGEISEMVRRKDVKALIQEMSKKTAMQSEYSCEICDADPGYCTCSTALQNLWNKIEVEEELEQ